MENLQSTIEKVLNGEHYQGFNGIYCYGLIAFTLDASDIAEKCRELGYNVIANYDYKGINGVCELSNGVNISTNGYVWKRQTDQN